VRRFAADLHRDAAVIMHPPFVEGDGMDVPEDAAIIAVARAACRAEGLPDEAMGVSFGSDAAVMTRAESLSAAAQKLVELANQRDGTDNISVQLIRIHDVERTGMYRGRPYNLR